MNKLISFSLNFTFILYWYSSRIPLSFFTSLSSLSLVLCVSGQALIFTRCVCECENGCGSQLWLIQSCGSRFSHLMTVILHLAHITVVFIFINIQKTGTFLELVHVEKHTRRVHAIHGEMNVLLWCFLCVRSVNAQRWIDRGGKRLIAALSQSPLYGKAIYQRESEQER